MKKASWIIAVLLLFTSTILLNAAEDENDLFGNTNTVVSVDKIKDNSIVSNLDKSSTSLSGTINNRTTYGMNKSWVDGIADYRANNFLTGIEGDMYLDIRITKGIKAFGNIAVQYSPQAQPNMLNYKNIYYSNIGGPFPVKILKTNQLNLLETITTSIVIKEFFLDANIAKAVYFRIGKQVLQWGRGYFWQPTDLININKKNFLNLTFDREGAFGVKIHVPFGTTANLYSFIDMTGINGVEDTAGAIKAEFLLGATEFAFSAWAKKHFFPVYCFDFSSRLFTRVDIWGEIAMSYGDNQLRLPFDIATGLYKQIRNQWSPKFCIGMSRTFDIQIQDRLMLIGEFYYDNNGYDGSIVPVQGFGVYYPGYFGKYNAALFSSFSDFFSQDLTLTLNGIANLSDGSFILSPGLSWTPGFNFTVSLGVNGFCGKNNTEYNLSGFDLQGVLTIGITF